MPDNKFTFRLGFFRNYPSFLLCDIRTVKLINMIIFDNSQRKFHMLHFAYVFTANIFIDNELDFIFKLKK